MKVKTILTLITPLIILCSCINKEDILGPSESAVPATFNVNISNSLSPDQSSAARKGLRAEETTLNGGLVYQGIRGYIALGEFSGKVVTEIMKVAHAVFVYNVKNFIFTDSNDGRIKRISLTANASYDGTSYQYKLTMIDSLSGKTAMEVFWNNNPVYA